MKVLVVDDEPLARDRLIRFLQDIDEVTQANMASSGMEALEKLESFHADVVLLDIRMPGQSGLEVAAEIKKLAQPPAVIFCTAYDDYALDAFKVNAQAYLMKPIAKAALVEALASCAQLNKAQVQALSLQNDVATINVHNGREKERLPIAEVYYFQADQKYVSLFSARGERIVDESLKTLEERFGEYFVRVHRSTLVQRSRIEKLNRDSEGGIWLKLKDVENPIAVSRRHARDIKKLFD